MNPISQGGLQVLMQRWDVLDVADWHVYRTKITWPDGRCSLGWGKSLDQKLAQSKSIGEAVERHAFQSIEGVDIRWGKVTPEAAAVLPQLLGYASLQYEDASFPYRRFSSKDLYLLADVQRMHDGVSIGFPAECIFDRRVFDKSYQDRALTRATSSGMASGRNVKDAIDTALFELIERDAFMRHWFDQAAGISVDISTLPAVIGQRVLRMSKKGVKVCVQSLSRGVYPVWAVWAQSELLHFTSLGLSFSLDPQSSLLAAVLDVELHVEARLAGGHSPHITPMLVRTPVDHGDLYASSESFRLADALMFSKGPASDYRDIATSLPTSSARVREHFASIGFDCYWIDLTLMQAQDLIDQPEVRTVRVLCPDLIPMKFGYGLNPLFTAGSAHSNAHMPHPFA